MKTVILLATLLSITALSALVSHTPSPVFTLDNVSPSVELISPLGGEQWYIGDTDSILWTGQDNHPGPAPISLWFSANAGASYQQVTPEYPNSGSYPWSIPYVQSDSCFVKIRLTDAFGNSVQDVSELSFSTVLIAPVQPTGVTINTSNNIDAIITWAPVTQTVLGTPIVPTGYLVLYSEQADADFYYLADVTACTHTHSRVVVHRANMFYEVLAYVDLGGDFRAKLSSMHGQKISKIALLNLLHGGEK